MSDSDTTCGCWCCGKSGIEHLPYIEVVSMDAESAKAFMMPDAVKVECVGQATAVKYKFGARVYRLFQTWAAWERYVTTRKEAEHP